MSILKYPPNVLNYYTRFVSNEKKKKNTRKFKLELRIDLLNKDQRKVVSLIESALVNKTQMKALILGVAGTGKSFVLASIRALITQKCNADSILVLAFTGVAASHINGESIHSSLKIPLDYSTSADIDPSEEWLKSEIEKCKLQGVRLVKRLRELIRMEDAKKLLKQRIKAVEYIIIDECSMLSLQLLGYIDAKLRTLTGVDRLFGRKSLVLFGDFGQIYPVGGTPLFSVPNAGDLLAINGSKAYEEFKTVIFLDEVVRQAGREQEQFRDLLLNLRNGTLTQAHINLLNTRAWNTLSETDRAEFKDATYLFRFNKQVKERNCEELEKLNTPRVKISCTADDGELLDLECDSLAIGAKVVLIQNIWIEGALVNGSTGILESIVYEEGKLDTSMPAVINVRFDKYRGSYPKGQKSVPIVPVVLIADALKGENYKQLPIRLNYSSTIHKAQSRTIEKAVVDFSHCYNIAHAIAFVAISRVPKLTSLALATPLSLDQFDPDNDKMLQGMLKEENRLRQLSI